MKGRKSKPTHIKLVEGNRGRRRLNPKEPKPELVLPAAPAWLEPEAREHFGRLAGEATAMRVLTRADIDMLALAATRLAEVVTLTAAIAQVGRVYETENRAGDRMVRPRPEVGQRNEALRHLQALLCEFGFSPAARAKVATTGDGADADPAQQYIG